MSMQLVSIALSAFYQNFDTFIVPTCTGTSPQAADVVGFTPVGVATEAIARGLSLQSGHTYYALLGKAVNIVRKGTLEPKCCCVCALCTVCSSVQCPALD